MTRRLSQAVLTLTGTKVVLFRPSCFLGRLLPSWSGIPLSPSARARDDGDGITSIDPRRCRWPRGRSIPDIAVAHPWLHGFRNIGDPVSDRSPSRCKLQPLWNLRMPARNLSFRHSRDRPGISSASQTTKRTFTITLLAPRLQDEQEGKLMILEPTRHNGR